MKLKVEMEKMEKEWEEYYKSRGTVDHNSNFVIQVLKPMVGFKFPFL